MKQEISDSLAESTFDEKFRQEVKIGELEAEAILTNTQNVWFIKKLFKSFQYSCLRRAHIKLLYNSKFDFTAISLVTNSVIMRFHCKLLNLCGDAYKIHLYWFLYTPHISSGTLYFHVCSLPVCPAVRPSKYVRPFAVRFVWWQIYLWMNIIQILHKYLLKDHLIGKFY